ncbi:NETI motif-containing protein [Bacillus mojavensis]|uniref:NETI motif-containing protein n=1 Tax=Bacillus mojavensis TaxID=72360 RepID=UPI002DBE206A|nr:NETI motif-containing protein [Bacillus mojavensis]MEC1614807.1 NETI motif-containing protein [Bacillus mojavensis]MEC1621793.1 NETI motif-containing protein [Bacillus mojavensis]MEC1657879.1 NETI motif-containing protein [Bacillus mojavensis]MEC1682418.1 NETI motif-containing protein [Bacillus mojavensis]MEC1690627.1 NETI motif-containing protein [Bacillus mojavensis]
MAKPKKKKFEVTEQQTIEAVLQQMKEEGYMPVRRMEEPIFKEKLEDGSIQIVPCGKKIVFEGKLI